MPVEPGVLLFIGFAALVVVGAIIGKMQAAKRIKALSDWAAANRFAFSVNRDGSFDTRYAAFDCLRRGDNRYAYNILKGMRGTTNVIGFDYHYQTYSRDKKGRRRTHHHHFSAVILDTDLPLRPLLIRPEGFFDKVTEFFGADDIDFELDAFSRAFYVKAPERQWAFDVIHQDTMEFLLAQPRFTIEMEPIGVIVFRGGRLSVDMLEAAMGVGAGILERLPRYLVNELKGETT